MLRPNTALNSTTNPKSARQYERHCKNCRSLLLQLLRILRPYPRAQEILRRSLPQIESIRHHN